MALDVSLAVGTPPVGVDEPAGEVAILNALLARSGDSRGGPTRWRVLIKLPDRLPPATAPAGTPVPLRFSPSGCPGCTPPDATFLRNEPRAQQTLERFCESPDQTVSFNLEQRNHGSVPVAMRSGTRGPAYDGMLLDAPAGIAPNRRPSAVYLWHGVPGIADSH